MNNKLSIVMRKTISDCCCCVLMSTCCPARDSPNGDLIKLKVTLLLVDVAAVVGCGESMVSTGFFVRTGEAKTGGAGAIEKEAALFPFCAPGE